MDTVNNELGGKGGAPHRPGILYPLMVIAAIAVIVFSVAGIATMMGWLPSVQSKTEPAMESAVNNPGGAMAPADAPPARPGADRPHLASAGAACGNCGVVESIRAVETKGEGTGLGAIGGAVVGGLLGNQVGRGGGRTAATVVGAGAGAYAGHEVERSVNKSVSYRIQVRMNDGSIRTFHERAQPALAIGQKVRVTDQGVIAAG